MTRLGKDFFARPCLEVAEDLVGKVLCHETEQGILCLRISQTEAYCGEQDTACHAHKGRTPRTEVMYAEAGTLYIYLCYGMHWLMNIVTGEKEQPEAVLIRACVDAPGPGKLTKAMQITGQSNRTSVLSGKIWVADDGYTCRVKKAPRVGIGFATPEDQVKPWRFIMQA